MATLDSCPSELCQRIFQLACTDDGTTARSLSLVSKYIQDTSKPYKLQSISIFGAEQAAGFALALQHTPEQYRRVFYLAVSSDSAVQPILAPNHGQSSSSPIVRATRKAVEVIPGIRWYKKYKRLKQNVDYNVRCMQVNRRRDESISAAFLQILHLTAATLRTLDVNFQSRWKIIPAHFDDWMLAFRIRSMPVLTSLTVHYYALFHSEVDESLFLDDEGEDGVGKALLPRLRYLDLKDFRIRLQPFVLYERIANVAPSLTHLRLPMRMAGALESALGPGLGLRERADNAAVVADGGDNANAASDSNKSVELEVPAPVPPPLGLTTPLLPATLQRVYIQLSPPPTPCCGTFPFEQEQGAYMLAVEGLKKLERQDERVVVLDCGVCEKLAIEEVVRCGKVGGEGGL